MDLNYFVCTLGEAAHLEAGRPYHNVNDLIDQQAASCPTRLAVGFYIPGSDRSSPWTHHIFSFAAVRNASLQTVKLLAAHDIPSGQTVGLLAASSPAFLFTWLALIRLGNPVLLIAPQCSPTAIAELSRSCEAPILFHDAENEGLAEKSIQASLKIGFKGMRIQKLPFSDDAEVFALGDTEPKSDLTIRNIEEHHIAYLHHSSGTSTGIPKSIPQSHRAAVGVLPRLDGSGHASFTTTPLYHGGVADLFRAWSSSALIWLFPSQHLPITATNITKCLGVSTEATQQSEVSPVKYFSSVPYVLQMMAQDEEGSNYLKQMDIVGVGGAALPAEIGDSLVADGIRLVSRYGSAECGFLMSSHRDYESDKAWQYLRHSSTVKELHFQPHDADHKLSELIVLDGWPHMAKRNRDNGSFATSDLFAAHPNISNAWKYHSRSDSQLTLVTGKKFDPAPLEDSIAASHLSLSSVLIFGNGESYPGALLFRSEQAKDMTDDEMVQAIAPIVEKLNKESQSHARIPRNMLVPMPYAESPLDKSSKGTVLRGNAEDRYSERIEAAYRKATVASDSDLPDDQIATTILGFIKSIMGHAHTNQESLDTDTDLFAYGVDSVACVQVRHALQQLLPKGAPQLPLTVVQDSGTVSRLSSLLIDIRHGREAAEVEDQTLLLEQLVRKYSYVERNPSTTNGDTPISSTLESGRLDVLLTGPTGSLGSHILSQLSSDHRIGKIYLLVRGGSPHAARERVVKALEQRLLSLPTDFDQKVIILPCKLSGPKLGLSSDDYDMLRTNVDIIFHLAWAVNFLLPLRGFASVHLAGLKNLLDLSVATTRSRQTSHPKFVFCSSVASVSNLASSRRATTPVPETIVHDTAASGSTGYSQSKLAAELICSSYNNDATGLRGKIVVIRVGQLSGDTNNGVWNKSEAYPLMLGSSKVTGVLPDLGPEEKLGWLPVDVAAKAFIEASGFYSPQQIVGVKGDGDGVSLKHRSNDDDDRDQNQVQVFHLLNPSEETTFSDMSQVIIQHQEEQKIPTEKKTRIVSSDDWLQTLQKLQEEDHSALRLLPFWQNAYGNRRKSSSGKSADDDEDGSSRPESEIYEMQKSYEKMPSMKSFVGPLSDEYMLRLWNWIEKNI